MVKGCVGILCGSGQLFRRIWSGGGGVVDEESHLDVVGCVYVQEELSRFHCEVPGEMGKWVWV